MIDLDSLTLEHIDLLPVKVQWALVHYWRDSSDFARAAALIDRLAERGGTTSTLLNEQTRFALVSGDATSALGYARQRADLFPSASAEIEIGRVLLATGVTHAAHELAMTVLAENPMMQTARLFAAEAMRTTGDLDGADAIYGDLLEVNERMPTALLGRIDVALARGQEQRAQIILDDLAREHATLNLNHLKEIAARFEALGHQAMAAQLRSASDTVLQNQHASLAQEIGGRLGDLPALAGEASPATELTDVQTVHTESSVDPALLDTLGRHFGFAGLRPGQATVVANVMAGKDTLAIMPTGSGKSLTFQLPARHLPGVTLVVSPLIALMKDQVESLPEEVRQRTRLINSTLSQDAMRTALDELRDGALKLVYVAPERLRDRTFLQAAKATRISLVVVDEAHCISLWGQDFRPDYLFIPRAVAEMGQPPVLAMTATATPAMAEQIATGLGRQMDLVRLSLFRPNLFYEVRPSGSREFKIREMIGLCRELQGSGIVYVNSRKDTESFAMTLRDNGVNAIAYHAGLDPEIRAQSQDRFMSGRARVVVATIAFGMGVDKANVRFIIHFNPPTSLEAYAQESGRAGRDGDLARCILLATKNDETRLRQFARRDALDKDDLRVVYANLKRRARGRWALIDRYDLAELSGGNEEVDAGVALGLLDQAGLVTRHPDVPATLAIRWNPAMAEAAQASPDWQRFVTWAEPSGERSSATIDVAEACLALQCSPLDLDSILANQSDVIVREGSRVVCIELLPAGDDAPRRVDRLLDEVEKLSDRRIRQVIAYAQRKQCRHVMLAAQFGERLEPCGTSCDVCAGAVRDADPPRAPASRRRPVTAADAMAVIDAVRGLPFPMGRTGLVKLLSGSAESRVREDRSPLFGSLDQMTASGIGKLIDELVQQGYLFRDTEHEYLLISLTEKGRKATFEALAPSFGSPDDRLRRPDSANGDNGLSAEQQQTFGSLATWRLGVAKREKIAPFIIASNAMLESVAIARPRTVEQLARISGFGPVKCEKYGAELLAVLGENGASG